MNQRDAALASLWGRNYRAAVAPAYRTLLDEEALDDARQLIEATDPATDIPAAHALGWFRWLRYLAASSQDARGELSAALSLLKPVFERNPYAVPEPLQQWYLQTEASFYADSYLTRSASKTGSQPGPAHSVERLPVFHATVRSTIDAAPANQPDRTRFLLDAALMLRRIAGRGADAVILAEAAEVTLAALGAGRAVLPPPTGIYPGSEVQAFLESVSGPPAATQSRDMPRQAQAALPQRSAVPPAALNAPSAPPRETSAAHYPLIGLGEHIQQGRSPTSGGGYPATVGYGRADDQPNSYRQDVSYGADLYRSGEDELPQDSVGHPGHRRSHGNPGGRGERRRRLGRRDRNIDIWPDEGVSDEDYWASVAAGRPLRSANGGLDDDPLQAASHSRPGEPSTGGTPAAFESRRLSADRALASDPRIAGEPRVASEQRTGSGRLGPPPGLSPAATSAAGQSGYLPGAATPGNHRRHGADGPTGPGSTGTGPTAGSGTGPSAFRPTPGSAATRPAADLAQPSFMPASAQRNQDTMGHDTRGYESQAQGRARSRSAEDDPLTSKAYSRSELTDTDGRSYRVARPPADRREAALSEQTQTFSVTDQYLPEAALSGLSPEPSEPVRHLWAHLPERVGVGQRIPLLVWISMAGGAGASAPLEPFVVPDEGRRVVVAVSAPGFELLTDADQELFVPGSGDSRPIRFGLRAIRPGLHHVKADAFASGTFLGRVELQVSAEFGAAFTEGAPRQIELPSVSGQPGEITLQVNREDGAYSFQLDRDVVVPAGPHSEPGCRSVGGRRADSR